MKYLNFSIAETSGRTFEVPMDKVLELVKEHTEDYASFGETVDVDINDDYELARVMLEHLDDLSTYELNNDYVETEIACSNFVEEVSEV